MPPRGGMITNKGVKRVIAFVKNCVILEAPNTKQDDLGTEGEYPWCIHPVLRGKGSNSS